MGLLKKPGVYKHGEWRYVLEVGLPGTKSETLKGTLVRNEAAVTGKPGEIIDTPIARFAYFDAGPWHVGWLSVLTSGGSPVFDERGELTRRAQHLVDRSLKRSGSSEPD